MFVVLVVFIMHITPNKRVAVSGKECGKRDRGENVAKAKEQGQRVGKSGGKYSYS